MLVGQREKILNREITTERLSLRPINVADVEALHSLWTDEQVRRFLWDGEVISMERAREIVEKSCSFFDENGFGFWSIRERGSNDLIGFAGYWHFRTPPSLELIFGVTPRHRNRGIASESGRRLIRYAFEELGFRTVEAITDSDNAASLRVLQKLDLCRRRSQSCGGKGTVFHRLTCDDWEKAWHENLRGDEDFRLEFQQSWDEIERFYREELLTKENWQWIRPILALLGQLREAGYDQVLRAGQSLYTLVLSRCREHGGPGIRIGIELKSNGTMEVGFGRDQTMIFPQPLLTEDLADILDDLKRQPIPPYRIRG